MAEVIRRFMISSEGIDSSTLFGKINKNISIYQIFATDFFVVIYCHLSFVIFDSELGHFAHYNININIYIIVVVLTASVFDFDKMTNDKMTTS